MFSLCRPVFIDVTCENATEAWLAFEMMMRRLDQINNNALALTRMPDDPHSRRRISVHVSWTKSQWYKEWFARASKAQERDDLAREEMGMPPHLKAQQQRQQQSQTQSQSQLPRAPNGEGAVAAAVAAAAAAVASAAASAPPKDRGAPLTSEGKANCEPVDASHAEFRHARSLGAAASPPFTSARNPHSNRSAREDRRSSSPSPPAAAPGLNAKHNAQGEGANTRFEIAMPTPEDLLRLGIDPTKPIEESDYERIADLISSSVVGSMRPKARLAPTARSSGFLNALAMANKRRQRDAATATESKTKPNTKTKKTEDSAVTTGVPEP